LSFSSSPAVTICTGTEDEPNACSITASPSGAASRQIAVMSSAPRSSRKLIAATRVPPVASIGSST
jgi:hypothetical protein